MNPRPRNFRRIAGRPDCVLFKPAGIPASQLDEVILEMDELEAIRLADHEGLYQEQAAERMNVSRQTFGRIVTSARHKVATALVEGLAIRIEGGKIEISDTSVPPAPTDLPGRRGGRRGHRGQGKGGRRFGGRRGNRGNIGNIENNE